MHKSSPTSGGPRKLIFGMPPYFDSTWRNMIFFKHPARAPTGLANSGDNSGDFFLKSDFPRVPPLDFLKTSRNKTEFGRSDTLSGGSDTHFYMKYRPLTDLIRVKMSVSLSSFMPLASNISNLYATIIEPKYKKMLWSLACIISKWCTLEDDLNGRWPWWKTTLTEDDINAGLVMFWVSAFSGIF